MEAGADLDVAVVGAGQAGLAVGYHLRRTGLGHLLLDGSPRPGGAWTRYWDSLRLFSPAEHSPLPGWWMPEQPGEPFPTAGHVVRYFTGYEERYALPVRRPVRVRAVRPDGDRLAVEAHTPDGPRVWRARAVVSATGTWGRPRTPDHPGRDRFGGLQLHAADYRRPDPFAGMRVAVVGGGNSAAQILAELSQVAETLWAARREPRLMPDDVDGRVLFDVATRKAAARREGREADGVGALGDIVMVPPVREARDRGVLKAHPMFERLTGRGLRWSDGQEWECDAVVWCTGFRPDLEHLAPLVAPGGDGTVPTEGTRLLADPRVHLVGYGDWTGPASATVIGAGMAAKAAVKEIKALLEG
ncbi:ArsO family NAD(P)H-dependent flavin-containing monooxygenase [Nocardiopsis suaedae]|uniref:ArsO family NAD(P)H-dependent flavin-containing monooxygenase n=1 Tax=Nocardiopsis suaedae TaxID=3018444 RepID=A0ABT4TKY3_9ACTN|nr:ArsO family NAD(P)H-dependent flavin-containing monooxygenase [Nocardiopsis suaedae]MDA2805349.1 ArsO family NAD(P)H-dependent flavin-containing monooxygenase [Nocardiopsis suaedae]